MARAEITFTTFALVLFTLSSEIRLLDSVFPIGRPQWIQDAALSEIPLPQSGQFVRAMRQIYSHRGDEGKPELRKGRDCGEKVVRISRPRREFPAFRVDFSDVPTTMNRVERNWTC